MTDNSNSGSMSNHIDIRATTILAIAVGLLAVAALATTLHGMWESDSQTMANDSSSEAFYVLVIGNDCRIGTIDITNPSYSDGTARSDTIILARIDPVTYTITLITVPRDYEYVYNGDTVKINETYRQGGQEALIDAVADVTGVRARYYFDMDFGQFEKFVTDMGGVTIDVPTKISMQDPLSGNKVALSAGLSQQLSGEQALALARERKAYGLDMEAKRQYNDRNIVSTLMNAVLQRRSSKTPACVSTLLANTKTDYPEGELAMTVADFVAHREEVTIYSCTGPYAGGENIQAGGLWVVTPDPEGWQSLMAVVEAGEDPTTVYRMPSPF